MNEDPNIYPNGSIVAYPNGRYFLSGPQVHLFDNYNSLNAVNPQWSDKVIQAKNYSRPQLAIMDTISSDLVTWLDTDQRTESKFIFNVVEYPNTQFGYRNGFARPYPTLGVKLSWFDGRDPPPFVSGGVWARYFGVWIKPDYMLPFNPARKNTDPDWILWKFETSKVDGPQVTTNIITPPNRDDYTQIYSMAQLGTDADGRPTEDVYITYSNKDMTQITCSYLVDQITTPGQIQTFKSKFSSQSFDVLMSLIAVRNTTNCPPSLGSPCSGLMGLDDISKLIQEWIRSKPPGVINAVQQNICNSTRGLKECGCINRINDPGYTQLAGKINSPDSCWYLPCSNSSQNLISPELTNPTCPNMCQIIYDLTNTGSLTNLNKTNIINCSNYSPIPTPPPPPPSLPPPPPSPPSPPPPPPSLPPPPPPPPSPPPNLTWIQKLLKFFKQ